MILCEHNTKRNACFVLNYRRLFQTENWFSIDLENRRAKISSEKLTIVTDALRKKITAGAGTQDILATAFYGLAAQL